MATLTSAVLMMWPVFASAAILFEDDFDDSPDWQSVESFSPTANAGWPNTWKDKPGGATQPPPQGWTSYRAAIPRWAHEPTFVLGEQGARGAGKGMTYAVEAVGYGGGSYSGGGLDVYLGDIGYPELFIRLYLKYDPATFHWGYNEGGTTNKNGTDHHAAQKIMRISRLKQPPSVSTVNPQFYDTTAKGGYQMPTFFPEFLDNSNGGYFRPPTMNNVRFDWVTRLDPLYADTSSNSEWQIPFPSKGLVVGDPTWSSDWFDPDGQWHSYEFRVKMNSAPGIADGEWELWIDGLTDAAHHKMVNTIPWIDTGGTMNPNWNWITVLDNITLDPPPQYMNTVIKIFMDDLVISTNYIGPTAQAGDTVVPSAPTGLSIQ